MKKSRSLLNIYINAIYCYEELAILNPNKFEIFTKLGELHFTIGKVDNLVLGRKYFSFVLTINALALRPLFGLLRTCEMLKVMEKNEINQRIIDIVQAKLKIIYQDNDQIGFMRRFY